MTKHTSTRVGITVVLAACCLLAVAAAPTSAQASNPATEPPPPAPTVHVESAPAFGVDLQADGTGQVYVSYVFDLEESTEAEAFESLRQNESAKARVAARFRERVDAVAADAATATSREMRVADAELDLWSEGDTGIAEVSLTWEGLAAVEGDQLVLTEPFASGFESDRQVVVRVPDGHEVFSTTPAPDEDNGDALVWGAGTDLSEFELVLSSVSDGTEDSDGGDTAGGAGPGFGPIAAVFGVAAAALVAARRA